jgi:predicted PurR-regulated permease PerM
MPALSKPIQILLYPILLVVILFYAREILIPICFAALLAMLFLSFSHWMEARGISRGVAAFICVFLLVLLMAGLVLVLQGQLSNLLQDRQGIEQRITEQVNKVRQYISTSFGISVQEQQQLLQKQSSSSSGQTGKMVSSVMNAVTGTLINTVLVLVYIFLFLYFRGHLKKFILRLVPNGERDKALQIIHESTKVSQHYLTGLAMMIVSLWVLYSIGFSIIGVQSPVFFAVLCGLCEIVPFVGNLVGTAITILFSLAQGRGTNLVVGILITYGLIQFVQSYILEPLIVGAKVNINPLFTILGLVAGELLWGIPGIILAIPLLAIVKIICDHIAPLQPFGFLIGTENKKGEGFTEKIKNLFRKKRY